MRITKISVKGLFGMFDHEIPLNRESRITIIHGPNGVGKTILMQMVHGLFHFEYELLGATPFEQFRVEFMNGTCLTVERQTNYDEVEESTLRIEYIDDSGKRHDPYTLSITNDNVLAHHVKKLLPELISVSFLWRKTYWILPPNEQEQKKLDISESGDELDFISKLVKLARSHRVLSKADILGEYPALHNEVFGFPPDWFANIQKEFSTRLVSIERLTREFEELELILAWWLQPANESGHFLKNAPSRLLFPGSTAAVSIFEHDYRISLDYFYTSEQLQKKKTEIDELRAALAEEAVKASEIATDAIEEQLAYLFDDKEEMQENPDYQKANLFMEILNERLLFKSLEFDENQSIQLRADNRSIVPFTTLSSGEQHLFILYYQLLYEVQPDTLVMIDEPELSMNVVWQRNFLKDLQRIIELRNFDVLIATHSPQIIHDKWDWMVPLGENIEGDVAD